MKLFDNFSEKVRTFALLMGAPIFGGLLAWQLYQLDPKKVCQVSFDLAKADGAGVIVAFQSCVGLYSKMLDIRDHAIIGLIAILGLGYIMMLMREFRMQGEFNGPLGWGAKFSQEQKDAKAAGAKQAAGAAVDEAQDIEREST
jgi:hypothetical protein